MQPRFKSWPFVILAGLALTAQGVALLTLHLKGHLIDQLVAKAGTWNYLLSLVAFFAGLQIFGALVNVLSDNLTRFFSVAEFKAHWELFKPEFLVKAQIENHHKIFNGLYNNIPSLWNLKVSMILQTLTATFYAAFFLGRVVYDEFWIGLAFIPILGLFSWGASHLYTEAYQEGAKKVGEDRVLLAAWLERWFRSARERSYNWGDKTHPSQKWFEKEGQRVADGIARHAGLVFKRDVFGSLLVDWPYILCVCLVLISVVKGQLSVGEFIIWTTLIDYLMSAFSSTRFLKKCRLDRKVLSEQLDADLGWIHESQGKVKPLVSHLPLTSEVRSPFQLLSGESVILGLAPGFYRIAGGNGSGKSTLIDTLIGFNKEYSRWDPSVVENFRQNLKGLCRVIERDCLVLPELNRSVYEQIYGELTFTPQREREFKEALVSKIKSYLPGEVASKWLLKMETLEALWMLRPGSLSSGEKIILAFMRMLASLDDRIKVIAVDECDSFLDVATARLFRETMNILSKKFAVWYVSHTYQDEDRVILDTEPLERDRLMSFPKISAGGSHHATKASHSFISSVYLLGFDRQSQRGFVTPCQVAALAGGSGEIFGSGNVGKVLGDVLKVVKRAFIHTDESFRVLEKFNWQIDSVYKEAEIGEIKSAGLALAIAILDVIRQMKGLSDLRGFAATGHILLDGSVAPVEYLEAKSEAAKGLHFITQILTFKEVQNLSQLKNQLLNAKSFTRNQEVGEWQLGF